MDHLFSVLISDFRFDAGFVEVNYFEQRDSRNVFCNLAKAVNVMGGIEFPANCNCN